MCIFEYIKLQDMITLKKIVVFSFLLLSMYSLQAQKKTGEKDTRNLIQFSGIVVEGDSLRPVSYTSIIVKNSNRGTVSDYFGYFSFVAQVKDTIEFSAIGFGGARFVIPDTLTTNKYSLIQVLRTDTVTLKEAVVFPWPTKEQFKQAFLKLQLPEDDIARAERNMTRADNKERMAGIVADGSLNYMYTMQQYQSKLYYAGQLPPNNLLNPIAWSKFIQAWKNGDFSNKKKKKDD